MPRVGAPFGGSVSPSSRSWCRRLRLGSLAEHDGPGGGGRYTVGTKRDRLGDAAPIAITFTEPDTQPQPDAHAEPVAVSIAVAHALAWAGRRADLPRSGDDGTQRSQSPPLPELGGLHRP